MGLTDDAIEKIRQLIVSGRLAPGARLPREQDLAAQLGISRSSMREAVTALAHTQVLDVRRGDGTYVTSLEPHRLLEGIGLALELLTDDTLPEIFEVRKLLEPPATALAASRITPEGLRAVRGHLDAMRSAATADELVRHDTDFHVAVMSATGNRSLVSVISGLSAPTLRLRAWNHRTRSGADATAIAEHEAIYDALAAGDPILAHAVAMVHVTSAERGLHSTLPAPPPFKE